MTDTWGPYPFCGKLPRQEDQAVALAASESFAMETSARRSAVVSLGGVADSWRLLPDLEGKILKMPFVPVKRNSYGKQISRHRGHVVFWLLKRLQSS